MLKGFENSTFFKRRNIVGADYVTTTGNDYRLSFCHVEKAYRKIKLKSFGAAEIGELKSKTRRKNIQLNISGKQVLFKRITLNDNADENSIISKVIPAGRASDFYFQLCSIGEDTWCAVVRKELLNSILEQFSEHKLNVIQVSLGPLNSGLFKDIIDEGTLLTSSSEISTLDGKLTIVKRPSANEANQVIDGKTVSNYHVNAFASALEYHMETDIAYGALPEVEHNWSESRYDQMKLILGGIFGIAMAVILLTNFFLRTSYEQALDDLSLVNAQSEESYQQLTTRQAELTGKKNLLIQNGMDKPGLTSYISDRIASTIPDGINLLQMDIHPLEKNLKDGDRSAFLGSRVLITGIAPKSTSLNKWTVLLDELDFIEEVTINNYSQGDRENPGIFDLMIELN